MSAQTFRSLVDIGKLTKGPKGWDTATLIEELKRHEEAAHPNKITGSSADPELTRWRKENADKVAMQNETLRGRLIETAAVHASLAEMSTAVTSEFRKLISRLPVECANQSPEALKKWAEEYAKDACQLIESRWRELKLVAPDPATKAKRKPGAASRGRKGKK